jgi:ubiquinone/menaquinone biosynthesis C-methylase UbiE
VSFYSETIFPPVCDFLLNRPLVAEQRRKLLTLAQGDILEIGFGTGLNLPHYPAWVHQITTVDPNPGMNRRARRRVRQSKITVDQRVLSSEQLPFADNHFDCVVSTFTLCSIANVRQALGEVYRVLRLGGRLLLLEHGLSPEPNVQKWQRRLNWLEMHLADGCHLDRNVRELVQALPFSAIEIEEFYLDKTPRTHGYVYRGSARK